jgi:hypothetical protein
VKLHTPVQSIEFVVVLVVVLVLDSLPGIILYELPLFEDEDDDSRYRLNPTLYSV